MSKHRENAEAMLAKLEAAGHNVDEPVVIGFTDGTEAVGPSLRQMMLDQAQLEEQADEVLKEMGL